MTEHQDNITQGIAGMTATAVGTGITWLTYVDTVVDIAAGITAIVAGIFTIIWTYQKIKEMRERGETPLTRGRSSDK